MSQLTSHRQNNEQVYNSWSHLTFIVLEEKYAEYLHAEVTFRPDLDGNDIQSSIL